MNGKSFFLGILLAAGAISAGGAQDITLAAASSLTDVLFQIQSDAQKYIGAQIFINLGGSGLLRRQIEEGAPVDVFFSASRADMDKLAQEGLIRTDTRRDMLKNSLVMIADRSAKAVSGRDDMKKLVAAASVVAVGNPDSVPAGAYAVEALKKYGLYEAAQPKLALGGTVREVLQHVQNGSAPLGLVFLTDALSAQPPGSVVRIFQFPADTFAAPIVYPVAVTTASKNSAIAAKLIEFLRSNAVRSVFLKAGFEIP
jgi:molybdate transport system substrate-binding protein